MSDYKSNLKQLLREAVTELYSGSLVAGKITDVGFYCDFDLSEPLNPDKISAINNWLSGKEISCAFELSGFSSAYLDGDANKKMLQRIYVAAFETQGELQAHHDKLSKAAEHDHKRLGAQLGLFSTSEELGQGLVLRDDMSAPNAINLWCVADNLRKGAATNAVQIAEGMLARGLL